MRAEITNITKNVISLRFDSEAEAQKAREYLIKLDGVIHDIGQSDCTLMIPFDKSKVENLKNWIKEYNTSGI